MNDLGATPLPLRLMLSAILAVVGALVMFGLAWGEPNILRSDVPIMTLAALAGAGLAGVLFAPFFGQEGQKGLLTALLGAFLVTIVGAAMGGLGFFVFDNWRNQQGPIGPLRLFGMAVVSASAVVTMILTTWVAPVWIVLMGGVHLVARWLRRAA